MDNDNMDILEEIFPQVPAVFLELVLNDAEGDIEQAIELVRLHYEGDPYEELDSFENVSINVVSLDGRPEPSGRTGKDDALDAVDAVSLTSTLT
jgi:DMRTA motif